jgi:dTDP-4-amino-4,6-dideoxygalactose transaminase
MPGIGIVFNQIFEFEKALADYTGAPYAIMTDCCTHAIELCLRFDQVKHTKFTAFTYLSILMTMHKLGIEYDLLDESWIGEYHLHNTRIWDSSRRLERGMYRSGQLQCLSFGHGKPLQIGHGGAILTDDVEVYDQLSQARYDGREISITPWQQQQVFKVGYHYKPAIEDAIKGLELLQQVNELPKFVQYPDCRNIIIKD